MLHLRYSSFPCRVLSHFQKVIVTSELTLAVQVIILSLLWIRYQELPTWSKSNRMFNIPFLYTMFFKNIFTCFQKREIDSNMQYRIKGTILMTENSVCQREQFFKFSFRPDNVSAHSACWCKVLASCCSCKCSRRFVAPYLKKFRWPPWELVTWYFLNKEFL